MSVFRKLFSSSTLRQMAALGLWAGVAFLLTKNVLDAGAEEISQPTTETAYIRMPFPENQDMLRSMAENLLKGQPTASELSDIMPASGDTPQDIPRRKSNLR